MRRELRMWLADKLLYWAWRIDPQRFYIKDGVPNVALFDLAGTLRTESQQ